jgi:hypothetical protein
VCSNSAASMQLMLCTHCATGPLKKQPDSVYVYTLRAKTPRRLCDAVGASVACELFPFSVDFSFSLRASCLLAGSHYATHDKS